MITADLQRIAPDHLQMPDVDPVTVVISSDAATGAPFDDLLQNSGFRFVTATGYEDVLALVRREQADVVVLESDDPAHAAPIQRALRRSSDCRHVAILRVVSGDPASERRGSDHTAEACFIPGQDRPEDFVRRVEVLAELARLRRSAAQAGRDARIVTHLPVGVLAVDRIGTISYANPSAARLLTSREDELIGQTILSLIRAEYGVMWMQAMNAALACHNRVGPLHLKFVRASEEFDAELFLAQTSWQGHTGLLVTFSDCSDRMAMRAEVEADHRQSLVHARQALAANARWNRELSAKLTSGVLAPLQRAWHANGALASDDLADLLASASALVDEFAAPDLIDAGLTAGLHHRLADLAASSGKAVVFESEIGDTRLAPEIEALIFRLVSAETGRALDDLSVTRVAVYLWQERSVLYLELDHDGAVNEFVAVTAHGEPGIDPADIYALGGNVIVDRGTTGSALYVELPLTGVDLPGGLSDSRHTETGASDSNG